MKPILYSISFVLAALTAGVGPAAAQYPAPGPYYVPEPYFPPRGAYRVTPLPDDDEDIVYERAPGEGRDFARRRYGEGLRPYGEGRPYGERWRAYPPEPPPLDVRPPDERRYGTAAPTENPQAARVPRVIPYEDFSNGPGNPRADVRRERAQVLRPPADITSTRDPATRDPDTTGSVNTAPRGAALAALPPDYQAEDDPPRALPENLRRQVVHYPTKEAPGTIVVDTPNTYLYFVLGDGKAVRYGIGVGREGFTWSGREKISKTAEWPDWHPPKEMIERQPYLPRFMAGGTQNPLGARALYLGRTLYRIHGTNQPSTIGQFVSSGCIRLVNDDVEDLYGRVHVGTAVVVLDKNGQVSAPAQSAPAAPRKARNAARKPAPRVQAHSAPPAATPVVTSAAIAPPANAGKDIVAPVDAAKDGAGARANPAPEKTADNQ